MTAFDIPSFGKDNMDIALKSVDAMTKGFQAMSVEAMDYSKRSMDASGAAVEKMMAVKSLDKAIEVQSDLVRSAYEDYVGQVTRFGEIVTGMAQGASEGGPVHPPKEECEENECGGHPGQEPSALPAHRPPASLTNSFPSDT